MKFSKSSGQTFHIQLTIDSLKSHIWITKSYVDNYALGVKLGACPWSITINFINYILYIGRYYPFEPV